MSSVSMRGLGALALLAGVAAAAPAMAQSFKLDTIEINGLKSVTDAQVRPALKEQPGDTVTIDQIKADQDLLVSALEKLHVTGGVTTGLRDKKNGHADIIFTVNDNGIQAPVVTTVAPKLHNQTFTGNKSVDSDKLLAATGVKPGDELTNERIAEIQKNIGNAYKEAKVPVDVTVAGVNTRLPDGSYDIQWQITETKKKKKAKDMDTDEGAIHDE